MASSDAQEEFEQLMRDKAHRNQHPEQDQESQSESEHDCSAPPAVDEMSRASMTAARDEIPRMKYGANTGPKGVITDAQHFRDSKRRYRETIRRSMDAPAQPSFRFGQQIARERLADAKEQGNSEDDDLDDEDDNFMEAWRRQRLQAIQDGAVIGQTLPNALVRPAGGHIATVDGEAYLAAIDDADANTVVLVYIYDDNSEVSRLFEQCLQGLAGKHLHTVFIKLEYAEAEIEPAGVPGIIAYRGGAMFASLIPLIEEMPDDGDLDAATLEKVLQRWIQKLRYKH